MNNLCGLYQYKNVWRLATGKIPTLHYIHSLLYEDDSFYLKRKKDKFNKLIIDFPIPEYTSQYTGVHFRKDRKRYTSYIDIVQKRYYLGCYNTELEAAIAYNNKIDELGLDKKKNIIKD